MSPIARHRRGLLAVALLAGAVSLPAPTAQAAPVFAVSYLDVGPSYSISPGCTLGTTQTAPVVDRPVAENGTPATGSVQLTGRASKDGDPTDVITFSTEVTATASVTSVQGNPRTLDLVVDGRVSATATKPLSACVPFAASGADLETQFTVAEAGFLTVTSEGTAQAQGDFTLVDEQSRVVFALRARQGTFGTVGTVYLPVGVYTSYVEADAFVRTAVTIPATPVSVSIHAEFAVAGSQTAPATGKATRYVGLAASRSCESDSLSTTVTANRKRAKKIKQVKVFVNDQLVTKVKTPRKGQLLKAPMADEAAADVRVEVTLRAAKPGRPAKSYEATASYAPCA